MSPEEIVRALAAVKPACCDATECCTLCDGHGWQASEGHEPDCPWRLAVEWVEANPRDDARDVEMQRRSIDRRLRFEATNSDHPGATRSLMAEAARWLTAARLPIPNDPMPFGRVEENEAYVQALATGVPRPGDE